jgi:hypothetical protein
MLIRRKAMLHRLLPFVIAGVWVLCCSGLVVGQDNCITSTAMPTTGIDCYDQQCPWCTVTPETATLTSTSGVTATLNGGFLFETYHYATGAGGWNTLTMHRYQSWGPGTPNCENPSPFPNNMTVTFSQPVSKVYVLVGGAAGNYSITDNNGNSATFTLTGETVSLILPNSNISSVTISPSGTSWSFHIQGVAFLPPITCNCPPIPIR